MYFRCHLALVHHKYPRRGQISPRLPRTCINPNTLLPQAPPPARRAVGDLTRFLVSSIQVSLETIDRTTKVRLRLPVEDAAPMISGNEIAQITDRTQRFDFSWGGKGMVAGREDVSRARGLGRDLRLPRPAFGLPRC